LAGFAAALGEYRCQGVRVVLSHEYVQYRILPWRDDLAGDEEYRALAQVEFSAAFGALADGWSIALSDDRPGVARVAAAIPSGLLAALSSVAGEARARLLAVQPYLAVAARWWRRSTGQLGVRWLLVHEPGRLCLAVPGDAGGWQWLRHLRVGDDWANRLPELLADEALLAGLDAPAAAVQVFAPGAGREALATLKAAGYRLLEAPSGRGFAAMQDGAFAPAWLA
jgi:hypothetical protein